MVVIALAAAALLYPAKKVFFSMSGLNDYISAADHLAHFRVKKALVSTITGLTKLSFSAGAVYFGFKPLFSMASGSNTKPSNISEFRSFSNLNYVSRVLFHQSFVEESSAQRISKFCQFYFKDYPVTHYDVAKECVMPLNNHEKDDYREWVLNDPIAAGYRTSLLADTIGHEMIQPLSNCTQTNIDQKRVYNLKNKIHNPYRKKTDCETGRIKFLSHIFKIKDPQEAISFSNIACIDSLGIDSCLVAVRKFNASSV